MSQLISAQAGNTYTTYDTKIPSLSDSANVVEAFKLYHYGLDSYTGSTAPSSTSIYGHLNSIGGRLTTIEGATYVNRLTGTANQVSVSASTGNVTVSLPSTVSLTNLSTSGSASVGTNLTVTGNATVNGNATIAGTLTVSGSATFINTTNTTVNDPLIVLADNNTSANSVDLGTVAKYNVSGVKYAGLVKDVSDSGKWKLFSAVTADPTTTVDFSSATYDTLLLGTLESTNISSASATVSTSLIASSSATFNGLTTFSSSAVFTGPTDIRYQTTTSSSTNYITALGDTGKIVEMSNAGANTFTVPLNSTSAFPVGSQIVVIQTGAGQTTITPTGGVTINGSPGLKLRAQWSSATLIKRATDTWVAVGDLVA